MYTDIFTYKKLFTLFFSTSFFKKKLQDLNIYVSISKLRGILSAVPSYVKFAIRPKPKFEYRKFNNVDSSRYLFLIDYVEIFSPRGHTKNLYYKAKNDKNSALYNGMYIILDAFTRYVGT